MAYSDKIEQASVILFGKREGGYARLSERILDLGNINFSTETFTAFSSMCAIEMARPENKYLPWSSMNSMNVARIWLIANADGDTVKERIANSGLSVLSLKDHLYGTKGYFQQENFDYVIGTSPFFSETEKQLLAKINDRLRREVALLAQKRGAESKINKRKNKVINNKVSTKKIEDNSDLLKQSIKTEHKYKTYKCIVVDENRSKISNIFAAIGSIMNNKYKEVKEEINECN